MRGLKKVIAFDMDHTLINYHLKKIVELEAVVCSRNLFSKKNYPVNFDDSVQRNKFKNLGKSFIDLDHEIHFFLNQTGNFSEAFKEGVQMSPAQLAQTFPPNYLQRIDVFNIPSWTKKKDLITMNNYFDFGHISVFNGYQE